MGCCSSSPLSPVVPPPPSSSSSSPVIVVQAKHTRNSSKQDEIAPSPPSPTNIDSSQPSGPPPFKSVNSLLVPGSDDGLTASARLRRPSLKPAGAPPRDIPPKTPITPIKKAAFAPPNMQLNNHVGHHSPPQASEEVNSNVTTKADNSEIIEIKEKEKPRKLVRQTSHRGMLSKLALQFPSIRNSFESVCRGFERYYADRARDGESSQSNIPTINISSGGGDESVKSTKRPLKALMREEVSLDALGAILSHISGATKTWSDDEVRTLFHVADLDGSKTISFREFLIAVAIGYFLKVEGGSAEFLSVQKGFKVVQKAFEDMDDDHSNSVDAQELKKALFATSKTTDKELLELRFKELDFDGDGDIYFPEFLYGFVSWVGFMDD